MKKLFPPTTTSQASYWWGCSALSPDGAQYSKFKSTDTKAKLNSPRGLPLEGTSSPHHPRASLHHPSSSSGGGGGKPRDGPRQEPSQGSLGRQAGEGPRAGGKRPLLRLRRTAYPRRLLISFFVFRFSFSFSFRPCFWGRLALNGRIFF